MTINYEIGKQRADKRKRITLLLCIGKTKKRIRTELFATPTDINRSGKLRNDTLIFKKVREHMRAIEEEYASLDLFTLGEKVTAREALQRIRHTDTPTFAEYADKWLQRADMKGLKNYRTAVRNFKSFVGGDIPFQSFTHLLLKDYMYTLRNKPRALTLYTNAVKKIYTDAEKDYGLKPFSSFLADIPRQKRSNNRALDADTLRRIFTWNGKTKRGIMARDCAILSFCLCGTNSADLYLAPPIRRNILSYDRAKTKDRRIDNAHIEIEIPHEIKDLVEKYKGKKHAFIFHTIYSDYKEFNKHLNIGLKKIQEDLGLERLTFYAFRHSWATIARNDLGISKWDVHNALNHSDEDTAIDDIYIKKDFRLINLANRKVVDYVLRKGDARQQT